jgi:thiol-disulfide isomerase/thioredoxin
VTIINFWFAGCTPCIAEFDRLNALYEKFKDNDRFQFLSFTFDSYDSIIQTKLKYDLPYEICSMPRDECQRLTNNGFSTTIIVDQLGIINFINTGGHTDKDKAPTSKLPLTLKYSWESPHITGKVT